VREKLSKSQKIINNIMDDKKRFLASAFPPLLFVILLWIIKISETIFYLDYTKYGILPGSFLGLRGVVVGPLIHANMSHLLSNSLPLVILGSGVIYFYRTSSYKVITLIYLGSGFLVWIFARKAYHIGASGLIYGLVAFLFFSGVIRRDTRAVALSLLVTFIYGSLVWGLLPLESGVSWESHIFGSFVGIFCAFVFKSFDPPAKYEWEYDDENIDENP
jgi:membrane associated rhomboid family serine protease